jgi:hypothetical protein
LLERALLEPDLQEQVIMRILTAVGAAVLVAGAATMAFGEDSYTTRIEPRSVYGATITIEEGVRVFRPLPSERHVIVNPGGMTPLGLGY